jgi:xanthine dehydrogenase accessory factor
MDIPLGPEIGQCCGGRTRLSFAPIDENLAASLERRLAAEADERPSVFLFGSGHVGLALARALLPLPFAVTVVETRAEALEELPSGVARHLSVMPEAFVEKIPAGGAAIILTHDHALDFLIASEALARDDLTYTGMIGSATKRATFSSWLRRQTGMETNTDAIGDAETMLSRLVLPVGGGMVKDKRPEVIAAMVAAELLMVYAGKSRHPSQTKITAG